MDKLANMIDNLGTDLKSEIAGLKEEVKGIRDTVTHVELNQASHAATLSSLENGQEKLVAENFVLRERLAFTENKTEALHIQVSDLSKKLQDMQARSMRDNLLFHGIGEPKGENPRAVLLKFLKEKMQVDPLYFSGGRLDGDNSPKLIWIHRCHRLGSFRGSDKPRPIVAHFIEGKDDVLKHTRHLAGDKAFVTSHLPQDVNENRKKLSPLFKNAKDNSKKPKYIGRGDSLRVQNQTFQAPKLPTCPAAPLQILDGKHSLGIVSTEKITEKGSHFVAHMATVTSPEQASVAIAAIKFSHFSLSTAKHTMFASRILMRGATQEYCDDDGEFSAGSRMMDVMREYDITNRIVVVSRWCGGTHLGGKRFDIITDLVKRVLEENGLLSSDYVHTEDVG